MKGFCRAELRFSLCGLNCILCPMHRNHCPGCGGGPGNQSCALAKCSLSHGISFCWQCPEYPCPRYREFDRWDSFVPHRSRNRDIAQAQEKGLEPYLAQLEEKRSILDHLLTHCNDGRRKTLFTFGVYLLPLSDLRQVMASLPPWKETSLQARAQAAAQLLNQAADRRGICLKPVKKPKKE